MSQAVTINVLQGAVIKCTLIIFNGNYVKISLIVWTPFPGRLVSKDKNWKDTHTEKIICEQEAGHLQAKESGLEQILSSSPHNEPTLIT